ncbi:hypothetical protein HMPREF9087_3514 [Enterococcus casseliflavus ATCC 12755]|uniref:Uncharacterized protein n=1 Tax=Enterococcus casseliflavus ATCC 12755 TaxID=888066 RepID=F0EQ22_ENTCA|nr:hypothetical protein HMPREF9087_3514 [Enterococcus casseliflavus ATCC 12755]
MNNSLTTAKNYAVISHLFSSKRNRHSLFPHFQHESGAFTLCSFILLPLLGTHKIQND